MGFDIIGDVHGQHDKLTAILKSLGYSDTGSAWRCTGRTAIFVGDLIDRGPKQWETLNLVRRMVDAGTARCIMGNHEFNAIAWNTPDPDHDGEYLRPHGRPGNRRQHQAFLDVVENTDRHTAAVAWFKTLPLWIDLGGVRVIHACWHQASIDELHPDLGADNTLTDELIVASSREGSRAHTAIETLCKGPEVKLPKGTSIVDGEGKVRAEVRVRWWCDDLSTYRKAVIGPPADMEAIPDAPMPRDALPSRYDGPPVIFGHYWFTGVPQVISSRFACVDFSAAMDGPLVCYRWDGEPELSSQKMTWVRS
jgi:hypothetical protein